MTSCVSSASLSLRRSGATAEAAITTTGVIALYGCNFKIQIIFAAALLEPLLLAAPELRNVMAVYDGSRHDDCVVSTRHASTPSSKSGTN